MKLLKYDFVFKKYLELGYKLAFYQMNLICLLIFFMTKNFNFVNVLYDPTNILETLEESILCDPEEFYHEEQENETKPKNESGKEPSISAKLAEKDKNDHKTGSSRSIKKSKNAFSRQKTFKSKA
jgi:hypothetical protein